MPAGIGIVLALPSEARILNGFRSAREIGGFPFWIEPRASEEPVSCILSGPGPERAGRAASILLDQGVRTLVSTGVSGGLSPDLLSGELILADRIEGLDSQYSASSALTDDFQRIISDLGAETRKGLILSRGEPITSSRTKEKLFYETGALAVDMESAAVAAEAENKGRDFAALRAVCDPAQLSLPFEPALILKQDGSIRYGTLFVQVLSRPAGLRRLYLTGRAFSRAMTSLARVWEAYLNLR